MSLTNKQKTDINKMNAAAQRSSLGDIINNLNGMANQSASEVDITGGYINGVKYGQDDGYSEFSSNGTLIFSGSATVWRDLFFPLTTAKQGQTDQPAFDSDEIAYLFPKNDTSHIMYIISQFQHDYALGTDVSPHVHWKQTQSGSVVFKMEYKWFDLGNSIPATYQTVIMDVQELEYVSGSLAQLTSASAMISGSHISGVSSMMLIKLYRDDNDYDGNAVTYQFDIHYRCDSVGSDELYTK